MPKRYMKHKDGFYWVLYTGWTDSREGVPFVAELSRDGWLFPGYGAVYTTRDDPEVNVLAGPLRPPKIPTTR